MRYHTNECVSCGMSCLYDGCPYYKVEHFQCDYCGEDDVTLYYYGGSEVCESCLLKEFEVVEGSGDL